MSVELVEQLAAVMRELVKIEKRITRKRQQAEGSLVAITARSIGDWHCLERHPETGEWIFTADPREGSLVRQGSVSNQPGPFSKEIILADPDGQHFYRIAAECIVEISEVEPQPVCPDS